MFVDKSSPKAFRSDVAVALQDQILMKEKRRVTK